ncbi:hypothetical protein B0H14DRAFT_2539093 [Mycena olivaceomarginata]|nr:hypothetical protein B0H14DRAFT_2539093 [Mycena olivaceomarginata]
MSPSTRTVSLALTVMLLTATLVFMVSSHGWKEDEMQTENDLSFAVQLNEPVVMRITSSAHYQFDTEEGAAEYAKLLPSGGHTVHIMNERTGLMETYTVTLFHQMKCLDILRDEYLKVVAGAVPSFLTRHCMNYLRQSILCRPNLRMESVKNTVGTAIRDYEAVCLDWTKIYEEAEQNYAAFRVWNGSREL